MATFSWIKVPRPKIEECDEGGRIVMRAWFGYDNGQNMMTYRAYRYPWVGRPTTKPDVASCTAERGGNIMVYASWNGATDVQAWNVYSEQKLLTTAIRNGFETAILVDGLVTGDSISVEAVGGVGDGARSESVVVKDICHRSSQEIPRYPFGSLWAL